jgi:methylmalonyl-CoA/ethylmalonyl-CoA epimerase
VTGLLPAVTLDHVGIAAAGASPLAELLGGAPAPTEMPSGVAVARFGPETALELVTEARPGSPVEKFLATRGPGLHHIALRVDEPLVAVLERLAGAGVRAVGPIAASADGRPSAFLHPSGTGGILVELVEGPRP